MTINLEETIGLIEMHGRTIVSVAFCDGCGMPDKAIMLGKLVRMRELIESLPEHVDVEFELEERTVQ
jgi:hypothetical protein